ncbi:MAG: prolipoprotein diacylglyceryl transferase [Deltaproteobacteria bacterium]|nr:prolipoprotein diacylglyceryl transferase [Deltaproteobacteria bacterium]MBW2018102.1 prolipoprotein diacylglyceryl transferase [Deltaproteobacteria bacterium]
MIRYPDISPTLFEFGPFKIRWYGLMYVLGFLSAYFLIPRQTRARRLGLQGKALQDFLSYLAVGLIVGARLGYVLFYQYPNLGDYLRHPLEIIAIWHGGMSFHGGLLGALLAGMLFSRNRGLSFWDLADAAILPAPIGLGLGRLGNFINGELFGRPTDVPWAMVFPGGGPVPRHPSQLYEAFLEGLVLFFFLWFIRNRPFRPGSLVCLFFGGYGVLRFFVEFFRAPDPQIGLFWHLISMGQILSAGMILSAFFLWFLLPGKDGKGGS